MWHWRILGFLFLAIGWVGIIVPVLPTTIFWIIAAYCFARSDPKIREWIYARPGIGPQVKLFVEQGKMTRAGKRGALFGMALAAVIVVILLHARRSVLAIALGLILVGAIIVISRKTGTPD